MKFLDAFLNKKPPADEEERKIEPEQEDVTVTEEITTPAAEEVTPAPAVATATGPKLSEQERNDLQMRAIDILQQIYDPEIPVNIYELGLVYAVDVDDQGNIGITMTLTTPNCPVAESMPGEVEMRVRDAEGVNDVRVDLVWNPPWDMTMMSEAARLEMGLM